MKKEYSDTVDCTFYEIHQGRTERGKGKRERKKKKIRGVLRTHRARCIHIYFQRGGRVGSQRRFHSNSDHAGLYIVFFIVVWPSESGRRMRGPPNVKVFDYQQIIFKTRTVLEKPGHQAIWFIGASRRNDVTGGELASRRSCDRSHTFAIPSSPTEQSRVVDVGSHAIAFTG